MRTAAALVALATLGVSAGQDLDLDVLLDRLQVYLLQYETELSTVIASERYDQQIVYGGRVSPSSVRLMSRGRNRRLDSEVAFLRLPGNAEWLGLRDVLKVDGKENGGVGTRLRDLVRLAGPDALAQAEAIIIASSAHNLGDPRSINMPSAPLEVLHPRHHPRFTFEVTGRERVAGVQTVTLAFEEFEAPTLIARSDGGDLFAHGKLWMEPANGRLWRVELRVTPDVRDYRMRDQLEGQVRIDFRLDKALGILVPAKMFEAFYVENGRGTGEASYSNYRRFTTAGRLIPQ